MFRSDEPSHAKLIDTHDDDYCLATKHNVNNTRIIIPAQAAAAIRVAKHPRHPRSFMQSH